MLLHLSELLLDEKSQIALQLSKELLPESGDVVVVVLLASGSFIVSLLRNGVKCKRLLQKCAAVLRQRIRLLHGGRRGVRARELSLIFIGGGPAAATRYSIVAGALQLLSPFALPFTS